MFYFKGILKQTKMTKVNISQKKSVESETNITSGMLTAVTFTSEFLTAKI
jgi:hypothetical protein